MSKTQQTVSNGASLEELNRQFFGTWAQLHAETIDTAGVQYGHPDQSVDCVKSPTLLPSDEVDLSQIAEIIGGLIHYSFSDKTKVPDFLEELHQPFEHRPGSQSAIESVADYLANGLNVAAVMIHADDGLTDVPRFTALAKHALAYRFEEKYLDRVAEIASPSLKFETYMDVPVPDMLSPIGETYWQTPSIQTETTELVRKRAGITVPDLERLYSHIAVRGGQTMINDNLRRSPKKVDGQVVPGRLVVISPPASRAVSTHDKKGELKSIVSKPVTPEAASLLRRFQVIWPVTIFDEAIKLGPMIDLPKNLDQNSGLIMVEDAMELCAKQLCEIVGKRGVARYPRTTERGEIYQRYGREESITKKVGPRVVARAIPAIG